MKLLMILSTMFLTALQALSAEPEIKGSPTELANYLSGLPQAVLVTGEGEIKLPADRAVISLKVTTENKSLAEALRANDEVRGRVASYLKERGLGPERIKAAKFSSTPKYGVFSEKVKGHRVENLIKVTAHDDKEFQSVAGVPDKFSEVIYTGVEFEQSNKDSLKMQATVQACNDAEERKKVFEKQLGIKLVPRRFFERGGIEPNYNAMFQAQGGSPPSTTISSPFAHSLQRPTRLPGYGDAVPVAAPAESVSEFGELVFKVYVTVEYAAEPVKR